MCGIAGFVNREGIAADRDILARMTATLAHRGPDGDGLFCEGPAGLGHRRLSIIDVAGGAAPMSNEDGTVWVTFNGEIYNDPELRSWLLARGHLFRTNCDTETLVHLYEEHGPDFVSELNGMFALAIWDIPRQRLTLARDRMGQKPLYLGETNDGSFVFGSEPKALLAHPRMPRALDPQGLARYLFYEYVPHPHTIWKGMRKLEPGHLLVREGGVSDVRPFWKSPDSLLEFPTFEEASRTFWDDFRSAVGRHRRSDVPLGVFLSGGVDSSSVAAALAELEPPGQIRTFSIGFDDKSFDESEHARAVAKYLGTDHHEQTFSAQNVLDLLPEVANWLDEPFGDASILPTHLLSRFAREKVTVALGGDGADELMAGYPTFEAERVSALFRKLPRFARSLTGAMVRQLPVDHGNISLDFKLKQFLRGAEESPPLAHQRWLGSFSGAEIITILPGLGQFDVEEWHLRRAGQFAGQSDPLSRSLRLYQDTYLPDDILAKVDRASMACGLEVRAPFLDAKLVDSIQRLPPSFKYGKGITKRLLKKAASERLPASILERPKKGFGIPVARWLRGPLSPLMNSLLAPDRLKRQGLFDADEVARRIGEHEAGVRDHRKPLWTLLMFQLWHDRWLGD
jgi:asparagine synthase (glutamine-hydrolysing)